MHLLVPAPHTPPELFFSPTFESPTQLQHLFRLLRRIAGRDETPTFGGVQHLLNRCRISSTHRSVTLPDSILLSVFAHLTASELGQAAQVCSQWRRVAGDELLWRFLIHRDHNTWEFLGHEANPDLFEATQADIDSKERYLRCSPQFQQSQRRFSPEPVLSRLLPTILRLAWSPTPPKLAILGPGLDEGCSGLARKILSDTEGRFIVGKAFPGLHGVGSGFEFTLNSSDVAQQRTFALTFLYSAPKAERERGAAGRLFEGRLEGNLRLSHIFKELCAGLNGLVYILDASVIMESKKMTESKEELAVLAEHCWGMKGNSIPLLVLALMPSDKSKRTLSCLDVIRCLNLNDIRIPWRVYSGYIDSANGIIEGLQWQLDTISQSST